MNNIQLTVTMRGYGHWRIILAKTNYTKKYPKLVSSYTYWVYTTKNKMAIDDYFSTDKKRHEQGKEKLIHIAQTFGEKKIIPY